MTNIGFVILVTLVLLLIWIYVTLAVLPGQKARERGRQQAEAINLFPTISLEGKGEYRTVRMPMNFHTFDALPSKPAPTAGQHTHEVLSGLGYSEQEIVDLTALKVIS